MPVDVSLGFDAGTLREFFFAKARSAGSPSFDVSRSGTAELRLPGDRAISATAFMPSIDVHMPMHKDADSGEWRLLVDVPAVQQEDYSMIFETEADWLVSPSMDTTADGAMNVLPFAEVHPAYVARVVGSKHQGSKGVGGRSACTAIAALAALQVMRGDAPYWDPEAVDRVLREGTLLYEHYMARAGGAAPAGVEHTEFDAPDGRAFEGPARELWEAGQRRPEGLAVTCASQTLVALALPGPPRPELAQAVRDAYRAHPRRWRPPPLAALPCTLLVFDSHRHTAERGGARDAAWLLFPSPEALAAYLGLERFPCFRPTDPAVTEFELMLTRQFAAFRFHLEEIAAALPSPPPAERTPSRQTSAERQARIASLRKQVQDLEAERGELERVRAEEERRAAQLARDAEDLRGEQRRAENAPCPECEALDKKLAGFQASIDEITASRLRVPAGRTNGAFGSYFDGPSGPWRLHGRPPLPREAGASAMEIDDARQPTQSEEGLVQLCRECSRGQRRTELLQLVDVDAAAPGASTSVNDDIHVDEGGLRWRLAWDNMLYVSEKHPLHLRRVFCRLCRTQVAELLVVGGANTIRLSHAALVADPPQDLQEPPGPQQPPTQSSSGSAAEERRAVVAPLASDESLRPPRPSPARDADVDMQSDNAERGTSALPRKTLFCERCPEKGHETAVLQEVLQEDAVPAGRRMFRDREGRRWTEVKPDPKLDRFIQCPQCYRVCAKVDVGLGIIEPWRSDQVELAHVDEFLRRF
eukprot:tig00000123_g6926.t1